MVGVRSVCIIVALAALASAPAEADHGLPHCEPVVIDGVHIHADQSPPDTVHFHFDIRTECV